MLNSVIHQSTGHSSMQTNDTLRLMYVDFHTDLDHIIRSVSARSAAPTELLRLFSSSPPAQLTQAVCRQLVTRFCKLHFRLDFITTHSLRMRFCHSLPTQVCMSQLCPLFGGESTGQRPVDIPVSSRQDQTQCKVDTHQGRPHAHGRPG